MAKYLHILACFWLFTALDSFIVWNSFEFQIRILAIIGVLISTIYLFGVRKISARGKLSSIYCMGAFFLWICFLYDGNINGYIYLIIRYFPVIILFLWPAKLHYGIYELFRKCILFFAAGSIIVSFLHLSGLLEYVPYFDLPAQSALHEREGTFYRVYICVVTDYPLFFIIPRACGMLQEPGHFAIVLGYVYITDSFLQKKRNIVMILCGLLTFSPNFVMMVVIAEMYNLIKINKTGKILAGISATLFVISIIFSNLSNSTKNEISFVSYGRNMQDVVKALVSSGSLSDALNERINQSGERAWARMNERNIWTGSSGGMDEDIVLSDYRGAIVKYGLIGLFLIVLTFFFVPIGLPIKLHFQLLLFLSLVMLHRSWMFLAPYLYYMMFLSSMSYSYFKKTNN